MSNPTKIIIAGGTVGAPVEVVALDHDGGERLLVRWSGGLVETAETLRAEIQAARASVAALRWLRDLVKGERADLLRQSCGPDGHGSTEASARAAFAAGLVAGLTGDAGQVNAFAPHDRTQNLPPKHPTKGGRAHSDGWSLGRSLRQCVELADTGQLSG